MVKKVIILVIIVALVAVATFVAGPFLAAKELQQGLEQRDAARLDPVIDYPQLRQNIKAQLKQRLDEKLKSSQAQSHPLALLGAALAGRLADGVIDAYVTPEGLASAIQGVEPLSAPDSSGGEPSASGEATQPPLFDQITFGFNSLEQFTIDAVNSRGQHLQLILQRQGYLRWRLINILLPKT